MLIEIKNQTGQDSIWVNPMNPALVIIIPSPLATDPSCKILTGGPVIINTSEAEAKKLLQAING